MISRKLYYAVIFTSIRAENDRGYAKMSQQMEVLAQAGFIGMENARNEMGITVSYWESLEAIANWKAQTDHLLAQKKERPIGINGTTCGFVGWSGNMISRIKNTAGLLRF